MTIGDIRAIMDESVELQMLKIIKGWPHTTDEVQPGVQMYWLIMHKLAMIDGITMNDNK